MKEFRRVLRLAARRPWSLVGVLVTSLAVALLWGANISALYPIVEVVVQGQSLPEYTDRSITEANTKLSELDKEISSISSELAREQLANPTKEPSALARKLALKLDASVEKRKAITRSLEYLAWAKPTIDRYAPSRAFDTLLLILGVLMLGTAIKLVALCANMMLVQYVAERASVDLRSEFFRKALHLDLDWFGENGSADLTARLTNDIALVSSGLTVLMGRMVREPLKMVVCLVGAAYWCPRLLLLVMVVTPIVVFVMHHLSRAIRRASRRAMEEMSQLYGMLNGSFTGIRVVKSFSTHSAERARFKRGILAYYRKSMKMAFYNMLARNSSEMLGMTTVSLAILAGGYLVLNEKVHLFGIRMSDQPISFTHIILFFGFLIGASDPARKLADVWSSLQRGIAASNRVYEIIDAPIRVRDPEVAVAVARPHHQICFRDVSYQYPSGPKVLQGIDLTIKHGETVAVVGPNGCGKSTLISLLCRFDDPQSGEVLLDETPVDQMRTRDLRRRIALVTQRTVLFDDTIENNIRYGTPGADAHAVVRAAKMAFADDFIRQKTPNGYETILGAEGMRLSGGQMQRIALARAFLRDPDVLILDEATSQIDVESEQLIHQALTKFLVDRTGLMITHRPSSLVMADRIVVIESGCIADSGRHEDLVARNSFYQSLCGGSRQAA